MPPRPAALSHLRPVIALTRLSLTVERLARLFWPAASLALVLGAVKIARLDIVLAGTLGPDLWRFTWIAGFAVLAGLVVWGLWRLRLPSWAEAEARLDATLPNRPLAALRDAQAIGAEDPASQALWQAHLARMRDKTRDAKAPRPAPALAKRDPFGLRLLALLAVVVALIFGPPAPRPEAANPLQAGHSATASWEGWISPPAYSGLPNLYLSDQPAGEIKLLKDSRITLRFYGEGLALRQDVAVDAEAPSDAQQGPEIHQFTATQEGEIAITGATDVAWQLTFIPDAAPTIRLEGELEVTAAGEMGQAYHASDDVAVTDLRARVVLDLEGVDRRYGLALDPMARAPLEVALPLPFAGSRTAFSGKMVEDFSTHAWANLPVTLTLVARDGAAQEGTSEPMSLRLPGRRFFQPVAKAVIEQRRDLMWNHANAPRVLDLLRAIAHRPQDLRLSAATYGQMRAAIALLAPLAEKIAADPAARLSDEEETAVTTALWDLALQLEEGDLEDARARLERAQERLNEAMRNGASPEEIAELMQELRDATDAYLDLLAQSATPPENTTDQPDRGEDDSREVTQDQIQELMDRIQELMEEGRMEEAQALMQQLDELLRNLQMQQAEGQGSGPQRPGQQQMEELQDTLRDQQELADEAFRDLQDQFNGRSPQQNAPPQGGTPQGQQPDGQQGGGQQPDGQQGGPQGQDPNAPQGPDGATPDTQGQGPDGQTPDGQNPDGQGQEGQGPDGQDQNGQGPDGQSPDDTAREDGSMADRQQGLRDELARQRAQLPGLTGEAAGRARDALSAAEEAMNRAEEALREGDLAAAIDNQAQALNALREGLRALDQAFAENDPNAQEQGLTESEEGEDGQSRAPARNDPLGRQQGEGGEFGSDQNMLDDLDPQAQAGEILEELRRRSGERTREESELDYLRRLLDQF